jgi:hypothetical protein
LPFCNSTVQTAIEKPGLKGLKVGTIKSGNQIFDLTGSFGEGNRAVVVSTQKVNPRPESVNGIKINEDVNSILFLNACAREGNNKKAYDAIFDFFDTAELLGWYEVVYEDGFVVTIPVQYGVNILDWRWKQRMEAFEKPKSKYSQNQYAYLAPSVLCSAESAEPVTFFAFEWQNPRYGKTIKEINLKSVAYGKNNENSIILLAISITENTRKSASKGTERN